MRHSMLNESVLKSDNLIDTEYSPTKNAKEDKEYFKKKYEKKGYKNVWIKKVKTDTKGLPMYEIYGDKEVNESLQNDILPEIAGINISSNKFSDTDRAKISNTIKRLANGDEYARTDAIYYIDSGLGSFEEASNARESVIAGIKSALKANNISGVRVTTSVEKIGRDLYGYLVTIKPTSKFRVGGRKEVDESLNEDNLNPAMRKDAKIQYKRHQGWRDRKKSDYDELLDFEKEYIKSGKRAFDGSQSASDDIKAYKSLKDKYKKKMDDWDEEHPFKLYKERGIEREDYPYYVTLYNKDATYEPAEGGYYVEEIYASSSQGFNAYEEAVADMNSYIEESAEDWEPLYKDCYGWSTKYIGEGQIIRIETNKNYLKAEKHYHGYESFNKDKYKSRKKPVKMNESENKKRWTDYLSGDVYRRLANCTSTKEDIKELVNAKWLSYKENGKADKGFTKEDALVSVLELLDSNSIDVDIDRDYYNELKESIKEDTSKSLNEFYDKGWNDTGRGWSSTTYQIAEKVVDFLHENDIWSAEIHNYEPDNGEFAIYVDGDWKHDHLRADYLVKENFYDFDGLSVRHLGNYDYGEPTGSDWGEEIHEYQIVDNVNDDEDWIKDQYQKVTLKDGRTIYADKNGTVYEKKVTPNGVMLVQTELPPEYIRVTPAEKNESIKVNIQEALRKIDNETYGEFDLINLYHSKKFNESQKKELVKLISENAGAINIHNFLYEADENGSLLGDNNEQEDNKASVDDIKNRLDELTNNYKNTNGTYQYDSQVDANVAKNILQSRGYKCSIAKSKDKFLVSVTK